MITLSFFLSLSLSHTSSLPISLSLSLNLSLSLSLSLSRLCSRVCYCNVYQELRAVIPCNSSQYLARVVVFPPAISLHPPSYPSCYFVTLPYFIHFVVIHLPCRSASSPYIHTIASIYLPSLTTDFISCPRYLQYSSLDPSSGSAI